MTPQELKTQIDSFKSARDSGQITAEEYQSLMRGLDIARRINEHSAEFEQNETIRAYIIEAMNAAQIIYP
jgi:hypothetical protein